MECLKIVISGAGNHARVLIDVIKEKGFLEFREWEVVALTDDIYLDRHGQSVLGVPVVGDIQVLPRLKAQGVNHGLVGIGTNQMGDRRAKIYQMFIDAGFRLPVVVHPGALIASHVEIGAGSVILAGAIVGTGCQIRENTIVNVGAVVDHGCVLNNHTIISDRACLTGNVEVGTGTLIGAGATILPEIVIGDHAVVAAGAVVTSNVPANTIVAGVPAKELRTTI